MRNTFIRDFLTGLTAIAGIVGLVVTLWKIGDLRSFEGEYRFSMTLNRANGISPNSSVTYLGLKVGSVERAMVRPLPDTGVLVTVKVRESVQIPENFGVFIERSLTGETALDLSVPKGTTPVGQVAPGTTHERVARSLMDDLLGPLERIGAAADGIDQLAKTYSAVGADVKDLLAPRTPADVAAGAAPNLRSTIARIDALASDASATFAADGIRADLTKLADRASSVLTSAEQLTAAWSSTAKTADEAITRIAGSVDSTAGNAKATLESVRTAAEEFRTIAATVNRGEGTVGQLVTNPELYNALRDSATRLDRSLAELQQLIEKYKNEGIKLKL